MIQEQYRRDQESDVTEQTMIGHCLFFEARKWGLYLP